MSQEKLIELNKEMTEQAQYIVQCHIDQLNKDYTKAVEQLTTETAKFNTFNKHSTWGVWALFWISGFLARGILDRGPVEWNLASFSVGISTGVCVWWAIYSAIGFFKGR